MDWLTLSGDVPEAAPTSRCSLAGARCGRCKPKLLRSADPHQGQLLPLLRLWGVLDGIDLDVREGEVAVWGVGGTEITRSILNPPATF